MLALATGLTPSQSFQMVFCQHYKGYRRMLALYIPYNTQTRLVGQIIVELNDYGLKVHRLLYND